MNFTIPCKKSVNNEGNLYIYNETLELTPFDF